MGVRINTIMQTCFFAISGVLPREEAIEQIKKAIKKTYGKKGEEVVQKNFAAVDDTLAHLHEVKVPAHGDGDARRCRRSSRDEAPDFVKRVTAVMMANKGDLLPVSAFPVDGTWPTGTTQWEKRNIALDIPVWDPALCIQCNKCAMVCPHAAIRAKVYDPARAGRRPGDLQDRSTTRPRTSRAGSSPSRSPRRTAPAAGCASMVCPAKDKANPKHKAINMAPQMPLREPSEQNFDFFLDLPEVDRTAVKHRRQGRAVPAAAVRVLRRLRRLRRDAVRQAADPALRRPRC